MTHLSTCSHTLNESEKLRHEIFWIKKEKERKKQNRDTMLERNGHKKEGTKNVHEWILNSWNHHLSCFTCIIILKSKIKYFIRNRSFFLSCLPINRDTSLQFQSGLNSIPSHRHKNRSIWVVVHQIYIMQAKVEVNPGWWTT